MTTEKTEGSAEQRVKPEIVVADDESVPTFVSGKGVSTEDGSATTIELGDELDGKDEEASPAEDVPEAEAPEGDKEDDSGDELPDYNPDDEAVVKAYSARYETPEGSLNVEALSADYWKSFAKNNGDIEKSGLPDGVYKYLEGVAGVTKDAVRKIEQALVVKHNLDVTSAISKVAPVEQYNKAIEWARAGGYTEEQKERFRKAFDKGGADQADAIEALMARFERSSRGGQQRRFGDHRRRFEDQGSQQRRPSSPKRDATASAETGDSPPSGSAPFKTQEEYSAAFSGAYRNLTAARKTRDGKTIRAAEAELNRIVAVGRKMRFHGKKTT